MKQYKRDFDVADNSRTGTPLRAPSAVSLNSCPNRVIARLLTGVKTKLQSIDASEMTQRAHKTQISTNLRRITCPSIVEYM